MTQISLSKTLAIIDKERGQLLSALDVAYNNGDGIGEASYKARLRLLNKLKKEFSNLSDADQIPLGL